MLSFFGSYRSFSAFCVVRLRRGYAWLANLFTSHGMSQKTCNGLERLKSCWMSICKTWHQFFTFFVSAMFPSFTGSCRPPGAWTCSCQAGHKRHLQPSKDEARKKLNKLLQMAKQLVARLPIEELAAAKRAQKASSALKRWSSKKVEQTPANGETAGCWTDEDHQGSLYISSYVYPHLLPAPRKQALCIS